MDSEVQSDGDSNSEFLPEGIGSDVSSSPRSACSSMPDFDFDDSNLTPDDLEDDEDNPSSADSDSKDKAGDGSVKPKETLSGVLDETTEADKSLTTSFLSVPDEMKPAGSAWKGKRKGKVGSGVRKKRQKKVKEEEEDESNGGDEAEDGDEKKQKRKSKPAHRRRNIKKFLTHGELTADTLTAQQQEEERRKRLEEQKNAAALNGAFAIPPELMEILDSQEVLDKSKVETVSADLVPIATVDVPTDVVTTTAPSQARVSVADESDEGYIVLGSSSEDEDSRKKLFQIQDVTVQRRDVIEISSDDDAVTILSADDDDAFEVREEEADEESALHTNDALNQPDIFGRVLVNIGRPQEEEDIFLPPQIARAVKPHQIGGIRFLYDNLIESLSRFRDTTGFGCILAHSMGLGKTLQMIAFIDVFLRHTEARTVLCIVPINTIQNWVAEFDMWLPGKRRVNGVVTDTLQTRKRTRKNKTTNNTTNNTNGETKTPDATETAQGTSLQGDGDSRGTSTPTEKMSVNDDETPCNGQSFSSSSSKLPADEGNVGDDTIFRQFPVFLLSDAYRTMAARHQIITNWHSTGGVLLMGYEMYRLLSNRGASTTKSSLAKRLSSMKKKKKKKSALGINEPEIIDLEEEDRQDQMDQELHKALCRPGPDLVVCDEGHRIKNIQAGISRALKNIRTRRRVVLTGYPLQNNLQEYWCMVDFVRPNFLGTRHEFANLFERPIQNGQCMDSTQKDRQLMRFRAHVLYSLLEGFVQRRGFSVLHSTLPPKEETVLLVRLTPFQRGLYVKFMQSFTEVGAGGWCSANPLKAFSVGCKIWNHPDILCDVLQKRDEMADLDTDLELPETATRGSKRGKKDGSKVGRKAAVPSPCEAKPDDTEMGLAPPVEQSYQEKVNQIISFEWARDIMRNYQPNKLCNGGKMVLLFEILENSMKVGDRLLVFTQSLSTLSLIEKFLAERTMPKPPDPAPDFDGCWVRNKTYFRLDGSTPACERERMINQFNEKSNKSLWLFLLSTRAGCLGINLIGANRVIVMDASWNPCHDAQAVCRVYRYGQKKRCYVYRMVTDNTLEKKIYDRQISKKGMSDRVVDELNPEMNLTKKEIQSLLEFDLDADDTPYEDFSNVASKYRDPMLANICNDFSNFLSKAPFTTDSLIRDRQDRRLTRAEKRLAKKSYEEERRLRVSYARPSYTAFYPKDGSAGGMSSTGGLMQAPYGLPGRVPQQMFGRPGGNVHPLQSTPIPRFPMGAAAPGASSIHQQRLMDLQQAGVSMQKIVATTDIVLPGTNILSPGPVIKAGETVTFIRTQKGLYLRTTEGRILAVRGPSGAQTSKTATTGEPPRLGQFTAVASMGSQQWAGSAGTSGLNNIPGLNASTIGGNDLPVSTVPNESDSSKQGDTRTANQINLQHLIDEADMAASLDNTSSSILSQPKFTFPGSTNYPQQTLNHPQQTLNRPDQGDNTQSSSVQSVPLLASSTLGASVKVPTTLSILSSSGQPAHVSMSDHKLPTLSTGSVPLAAIGRLGPFSAPGQSTNTLSKSSTDIPLTLNSLLDGDPVRIIAKNPTVNSNENSEQSAISDVEIITDE